MIYPNLPYTSPPCYSYYLSKTLTTPSTMYVDFYDTFYGY